MELDDSKKTLYIFIDESGNFDFTPNGTKYFVMTAVSTMTPLESRVDLLNQLHKLKYQNWSNGVSDYYFHATEDKQDVRDTVFSAIRELNDIEIDTIFAQKNKTHPSLYTQLDLTKKDTDGSLGKPIRSEERFYDKISQILLQYIFKRCDARGSVDQIVVVLGSIFTNKKRDYVLKSLKQYLKSNFDKPFYIYFHPTSSDINCQIADYCGWAIYVRLDRGEDRPWKEIKLKVKSHFDVFERGDTEYYEYKK